MGIVTGSKTCETVIDGRLKETLEEVRNLMAAQHGDYAGDDMDETSLFDYGLDFDGAKRQLEDEDFDLLSEVFDVFKDAFGLRPPQQEG